MISKLACIVITLISLQASKAQPNVFTGNDGTVNFYYSAPLEDIEGTKSHVFSSLNTGKRNIEIKMLITQFEFRNKLMQEHFNENFMDSKRYPQATFKGKIYESVDFSKPGVYQVTATGEFDLHGVDRIRTIHGTLTITPASISIETQFDVLLADHKIDIPEIIFNKVAEKIRVKAKVQLSADCLVAK